MKITKNKTKYLVLVTCLILGGIGSSQVQAKELDPNKPKTEQVEKQNTEKDKEKDKEKAPAGDFKVSFVTNSDDKIKDITVAKGSSLELPTLSTKDKLVSGWYIDKAFETQFKDTDQVMGDITLYAKWVSLKDYVTKGTSNLIYDKAISDKVKQFLDKDRTLGVTNKIKEEEPKQDENSLIQSTNYMFQNQDINKSYLLTFVNQAGDFVFSMVQPYNKDIKILNSDDSLFKEYFVRQDTTITLPEVYSDDSNSDVVFKAKEAKKNNQSQVQIFSQLEPKKQQEVADEEKVPEKTEKKQKISWVSIAVGVLGLLALGFVFFKFKKSSKKVEDEENLGNDFESEENEDFDEDFEDEDFGNGSEENEELDEDFDWNTDEDFENTSDEFEDEVSDKDLEDLEAQVKKKKLKRKQQLEQQLRELDSKLN